MKSKYIFVETPVWGRTLAGTSFKFMFLVVLIITGVKIPAAAQVAAQYAGPNWWFGVAGGANFNFYRGSTQKLNDDITAPVPFQSGSGAGLWVAPVVEYHFAGSRFGIMLQAGYDNRQGTYKEVVSPCNCPTDLSTNLSYITLEPSVRFTPLKTLDLYVFGGPRVAYNVDKSFIYQQKPNPDYPDQETLPASKGDLSDINKIQVSVQVGAGYDIHLSKKGNQNQFVLSPFVSFQPYFGQQPRSIETWNITTLRGGMALKFGRGQLLTPVKGS